MKILHLETGRYLYGGGRQVLLLLDGLAAAGIENVLLARPGADIAGATAARCLELPCGSELDWRLFARLRDILRAEQPDLLHVHARGAADLYGARAAAAAGIPALLTRRVDASEPGWWLRRKWRSYAAVIAISKAIERALKPQLATSGPALHCIPSAVDPTTLALRPVARRRLEARFGLGPESIVLAMVAQYIRRKGHAELLAALPDVLERHPRVQVLLLGRGPLAHALQRAVTRPPLAGRVQVAGFEPGLAQYVAGFDLLVHPALREGLGVAVLEAMAARVPVIASTAGGLGELICDGETGLSFPPGNSAALATALNRALAEPGQLAAMAAKAAAVADRHAPAAMVSAHVKLYSALIRR